MKEYVGAVLRSWVFWGVFLGIVLLGIYVASEPLPEDEELVGRELRVVSLDKKATLTLPNALKRFEGESTGTQFEKNIVNVNTGTKNRDQFYDQVIFPHPCYRGTVIFDRPDNTYSFYPASDRDILHCRYMLFLENNHYFMVEDEKRGQINLTIRELSIKVIWERQSLYLVFPVAFDWGKVIYGNTESEISYDDVFAFKDYAGLCRFYEALDENYRCFDDANQVIYVRLHHQPGIMSRMFAKLELLPESIRITLVPEEEIPLITGTKE
ncbi:MAG: hypothetical protein J5645_00380 [Lachnospiraceae bacterium]|nr:hypothetical protein [Lachnospiraceae bacterium]